MPIANPVKTVGSHHSHFVPQGQRNFHVINTAAQSIIRKQKSLKNTSFYPQQVPQKTEYKVRHLGRVAARSASSFGISNQPLQFDVLQDLSVKTRSDELLAASPLDHFNDIVKRATRCDVNPAATPLTVLGGFSLSQFVNLVNRDRIVLDALLEAWTLQMGNHHGSHHTGGRMEALAQLSQQFKAWVAEAEQTVQNLNVEKAQAMDSVRALSERNNLLEKVTHDHQRVLHRLREENERLHQEVERLKVAVRRLGGNADPVDWAKFFQVAARG